VLAVKILVENKTHQKVFNLGNITTDTLKDVLIKIQELSKSGDLIDFGSIPYRSDQVMRLEPCCEGLVGLGWRPVVPLNNGLIQTINWFTNQPETALQTEVNSSLYFDLPERIKRINN
jgi:nucleoside-diphosphate-sugar epimerase